MTVATLLGQLDRFDFGAAGWAFDLFAHFPRHLAMIAFVVAALATVVRLWRPAAVGASMAIVNAALVLTTPGYATARAVLSDTQIVRVVSFNAHGSVEALRRLSKLAREYGADLISVYEAPALSDENLQATFSGARVRLIRQSPDERELSKKMLLVSALRITEPEIVTTGGRSNRAVLRYRLNEKPVQMVAAHPVSPDSPAGMRDRDRMLASLAQGLDQTSPFIIMGDFNASPWSRIYRQIPGTRAGDPRFESTFPAQAPLLGIPIDHILFGGGLELLGYRVGPDLGSDHLPLFATFALPAT